jgi:hypothetical protein
MKMIERVARASFTCWRNRMTEKGQLLDKGQTFEDMSSSEQEFAYIHARAIISAMLEPTDEMIESGLISTVMWQDIKGSALIVNRAKMKLRYQAMIDRALEG